MIFSIAFVLGDLQARNADSINTERLVGLVRMRCSFPICERMGAANDVNHVLRMTLAVTDIRRKSKYICTPEHAEHI